MALEVAVLNAGADGAVTVLLWAAIHSDATSGSQISNERIAVTWDPATGAVAPVNNAPLAFTGTAAGRAGVFLGMWNQDQPGGTFRGSVALVGDGDFNAAGEYNVNAVTMTATDQTA